MCPGLGVTRWVVFLVLWPDIIQLGRVTSDVVRGMSVTNFTTVVMGSDTRWMGFWGLGT